MAEAEQKKAKKRKNGKNTSQLYTGESTHPRHLCATAAVLNQSVTATTPVCCAAALLTGHEASQNLLNRATQLTQAILTAFAKEHGHVQQQQLVNLAADLSTAAELRPAILSLVSTATVPLHSAALPDTTCPESSTDADASESAATAVSTEESSLATTTPSSTSAAGAKSNVSCLDVEDLSQRTQVVNIPKVAGSNPEQPSLAAPLPGLTHVGPIEEGKEGAGAALAASAADHVVVEQPLQSCSSDCRNWAAKYLQTINEWQGPLL